MVMLAAMTILVGCAEDTNGTENGAVVESGTEQDIGQGDTTFRFEVVDPDEVLSVWNVSTSEETLGAALVAVGLIAGDDTEWGLMVSEVNGIVADFNANGAWWALWVDGEFAMTGVDGVYVESGATYAFVYTID